MAEPISKKRRYTVMVSVIGSKGDPNEARVFRKDFSSTNPEKYLERYHKTLSGYGWRKIEFTNLIER